MQTKCILIILGSKSMRLFLAEQPHYSFIDIEYNDKVVIDLEMDIIGDDILIGEERNSKNRSNYINPILSAELNSSLFVGAVRKILSQLHDRDSRSTSFAIAMSEMLVSVVFELGIEYKSIETLKTHLRQEVFLDVHFHVSKSDNYLALPKSSKPLVLVKSIGEDLHYFYKQKDDLKQIVLPGLAKDPLLEVIINEIFKYIVQTNAHLQLDLKNEYDTIRYEALTIIANPSNISFGELLLSNGTTAEYRVILTQCKNKAEQSSNSGLIIRQITDIAEEIATEEKNIRLYYTGTNINNDNFKSLFAQKISDVLNVPDDYLLEFQQNVAKEWFSTYKRKPTSGGIVIEPNATNDIKHNPERESAPKKLTEVIKSSPLTNPKVISTTNPRSPLSTPEGNRKSGIPSAPKPMKSVKKMAPPPPPPRVKQTTSNTSKPSSPPKKVRLSPTLPPPRGIQSTSKPSSPPNKVRLSPPPPPPPPRGKQSTSNTSKPSNPPNKLRSPPPPPPPKKK